MDVFYVALQAFPSDFRDEEWSLVVSYLTFMTQAAPQRDHSMRELFNALHYGIAWRAMPNDFPPSSVVYQRAQRWLPAGCFETLAQDLRALRLASGRAEEPTAAIIDSCTLRSTPEGGTRAGYDSAERKRGSKVRMVEDTLGHPLALHVTPPDVGDRGAVVRLAAVIQDATGDSVRLAYVDQGYAGETAADTAAAESITLHVVKLPEAKRGFVLLPQRRVVERSFAWAKRCRRLVKDYERSTPQHSPASTSSPSSDTCSSTP